MNPLTPFILVLLVPVIYGLVWNRRELRSIILISLCCVAVVFLYPLTAYLAGRIPLLGYSIGKFVLFVLLPVAAVFYIEGWSLKDIFINLGVRREGLKESVLYGILAAVATITITVLVSGPVAFDLVFRTIMFFESFTEEFLFRGFLFLYLLEKSNRGVAYSTSVLGFVLIHPQHFGSIFIISTIAQGVLLTVVADRTRNIIGPWIAHGLNRVVPGLVRVFLGM